MQTNLTTVHVTGTVAAPIVKSATFSDVSKGLKQFLTGQVNGNEVTENQTNIFAVFPLCRTNKRTRR